MAVIVLVAITALGPAQWQPRTGFGWEVDHALGYFTITLLVCFAWPRPLVVGSALMAFAVLLEALQNLTPDRSASLVGALYSAGVVLLAALLAELFIRVWGRHTRRAGTNDNQKSV